ncbi:hypothetical protein RDV64_10780 [Acuticoccus sp. MNP-M23]|uniref:hypothetical protein n=1 Tax=Acuticoccus sp. MNP-M23 TaxID=3072793 RepID=UPI00281686B6|nr:hypothetical protein [Acuticoccus sp. MNP-M23]WMS44832.1 hypothetical protein RDV64_10780 [Acuticoccus sp. MNP-M23]
MLHGFADFLSHFACEELSRLVAARTLSIGEAVGSKHLLVGPLEFQCPRIERPCANLCARADLRQHPALPVKINFHLGGIDLRRFKPAPIKPCLKLTGSQLSGELHPIRFRIGDGARRSTFKNDCADHLACLRHNLVARPERGPTLVAP